MLALRPNAVCSLFWGCLNLICVGSLHSALQTLFFEPFAVKILKFLPKPITAMQQPLWDNSGQLLTTVAASKHLNLGQMVDSHVTWSIPN